MKWLCDNPVLVLAVPFLAPSTSLHGIALFGLPLTWYYVREMHREACRPVLDRLNGYVAAANEAAFRAKDAVAEIAAYEQHAITWAEKVLRHSRWRATIRVTDFYDQTIDDWCGLSRIVNTMEKLADAAGATERDAREASDLAISRLQSQQAAAGSHAAPLPGEDADDYESEAETEPYIVRSQEFADAASAAVKAAKEVKKKLETARERTANFTDANEQARRARQAQEEYAELVVKAVKKAMEERQAARANAGKAAESARNAGEDCRAQCSMFADAGDLEKAGEWADRANEHARNANSAREAVEKSLESVRLQVLLLVMT
jgi:hypothetical protein